MEQPLQKYTGIFEKKNRLFRINGKVSRVIGLVIESNGPTAEIGEICHLLSNGDPVGQAEVIGFRQEKTLLMPLCEMTGIRPGLDVVGTGRPLKINIGSGLLGRVIDGLGNPMDGKGPLSTETSRPVFNIPPNPLTRKRIHEPMVTGIRSIDTLLTLGKGQRVGIFAGSGVGKSVMLGMIARHCLSEVNVIALIGERGREVREFLERDLGETGLKRSVVVVATSDQPALIRLKGALTATAVAEYFRDIGKDVMLLFDSTTRVAMAQREIGLSIGEPPATKGYTPSVFAFLPRLLERAGMAEKGSITGMYTVLVEGDDLDEPVSDAMRAILDGHIILSRGLANRGHYPAVDALASISRVMPDVTDPAHRRAAKRLLSLLAEYRSAEDLITIGAYTKGSNAEVDKAIAILPEANKLLRQEIDEKSDFAEAIKTLHTITGKT